MAPVCKVLLVVLACVAYVAHAGVIKKNSPDSVERLRNLRPDDLAEELSGQYEGDMVLTEDQERAVLGSRRNGLVATSFRWKDNIVPVQIVEEDFTPEQVEHIRRGMRLLESVSCLRFVPRTEAHTNYVRVIGTDGGCYSYVGQLGGEQTLNLQPYDVDTGCFRLATIQHEFLHALGFYHQQSASDRDDFVDIIWNNIEEGKEHNFNIYPSTTVTDFGVRYDYGSVMHYSATAFSKNGQRTIIPKDPNAAIGQRLSMSERDISKLNHMYGCLKKA